VVQGIEAGGITGLQTLFCNCVEDRTIGLQTHS